MTQILYKPFTPNYPRQLSFGGNDAPTAPKSSGQTHASIGNASNSSHLGWIKKKKVSIPLAIAAFTVICGGITGGLLGDRKSSTSSSPTMPLNGSATTGTTTLPSRTSAPPTPTLFPGEPSDCPTLLNGTVAVAYGGNEKGTDFTMDHCPSFALVNLDKPKPDDPHLMYYLYQKPDHRTAFDAYDDYIGEVRQSMDGLDNAWNNDGTLQGTTNSSSPSGKVPFIAGSNKSLLDFLTGKTAQYPNFDPQNMTDQAGIVERAGDNNTATIFTYQFNPDGTLADKKKIGIIKNSDIETDPASPEAATLATYIAKLMPGHVLRKK